MIRWVVGFDGRVIGVGYDDTHQWLLGPCVKFSQTAVLVVKGSVRSSGTVVINGKIDLSCIAVWGRTGLYYCQQIVACPSRKMLATASRIGFSYLSKYILTVSVCSAALCLVWLRSILRNWSWLQFKVYLHTSCNLI